MNPLVDKFLGGKSGLLVAMGPTGSGKTHTVFGTARNPGLVPLTLQKIFTAADESEGGNQSPRAPSLMSLRLISCYDVSDDGLTEAIMKFPLLEELELSLCPNADDSGVFGVIGKACPQLKRFRLSKDVFFDYEASEQEKDEEALGIATMHELRSLQLFGNSLTNKGLTAILDNCRHLESLAKETS